MSYRRYTATIIATTAASALAATYFIEFSRSKRGQMMSTHNYMADSFKKHDNEEGIPPELIQAEVDKMLAEARARPTDFQMIRIQRPDETPNKPRRFDLYTEEDEKV